MQPVPATGGVTDVEELHHSYERVGVVVRQSAGQQAVNVVSMNVVSVAQEGKLETQEATAIFGRHLDAEIVPVNQPFYALVSRSEEEVRTEASEEERDVSIQLLIHFSGLHASLQCQRRAAEQRLLELQEGRLDSQQLLQSCAACQREGGCGYRKRLGNNVTLGVVDVDTQPTESMEGGLVHGGSILRVK